MSMKNLMSVLGPKPMKKFRPEPKQAHVDEWPYQIRPMLMKKLRPVPKFRPEPKRPSR